MSPRKKRAASHRCANAVGALTLVVLLAGCGSSKEPVDTDATAMSRSEQADCVPTPVSGASGTKVVLMPPAPQITRAWHDEQRFYVDLQLRESPDECEAAAVLVTASSIADGSNQALPLVESGGPRGDGRALEYRPGRMRVILRRPILDLPPYNAYASASGAQGERSPVVRYAIPETGDYCLKHRPADRCIREAQALAKRCVRGEVSRTRCADWSYGASRPSPAVPVTGASVAEVRANLRTVLTRQLSNDVSLSSLMCTDDFVCTVTFRRLPQEGRMRVRYALSGHKQEPGCWYATTIDVMEPNELAPPSPLAAGVPLNAQASCLSWKR